MQILYLVIISVVRWPPIAKPPPRVPDDRQQQFTENGQASANTPSSTSFLATSKALLRDPSTRLAIIAGTTAYCVMAMIMPATPVAMVAHGYLFKQSVTTI
ncbi:hypothetical protein DFJ77DRAFT_512452 [Powellomyces hirtus]|nr:hypothetical protein DFJ77DRAFT_512452 [Powellomyces hirtus]